MTSVTATKGDSSPNSIGAGAESTCGTITIGSNLIDATSDGTRTLKGVVLFNGSDNTDVISAKSDYSTDVQLSGRTLYKDGAWNTLCLPFDISTTTGLLSGNNVTAMTLNKETSGLSGATLTLNFDAAPARSLRQ